MKKTKNNDYEFIYFILVIFAVILSISLPFIDKARCEKNGGKYIWEWSEGSKCHLVGDK